MGTIAIMTAIMMPNTCDVQSKKQQDNQTKVKKTERNVRVRRETAASTLCHAADRIVIAVFDRHCRADEQTREQLEPQRPAGEHDDDVVRGNAHGTQLQHRNRRHHGHQHRKHDLENHPKHAVDRRI